MAQAGGLPFRSIDKIRDVPAGALWGSLFSADPLIIGTAAGGGFGLGAATALGPLLRGQDVHFLIFPSYAWERPGVANALIALARAHRAAFPGHRTTFLCSVETQGTMFHRAGEAALTLNWNLFVNDAKFRPLAGAPPSFDAVYNARLSPAKRHELAKLVDSLSLIYFRDPAEQDPAAFHAAHARLRILLPQATFANRLTADGCEQYGPRTVNRLLNQARVGLCLSSVEGQMRASMEYMMAGLPLVSTASQGGRDYFFDDGYCAVAADDPRDIRDATAAIVARGIPREHVRARTMARVSRERDRFIAFVQDLVDRSGGRLDFAARFAELLAQDCLIPWVPARAFALVVMQALSRRDGLSRRLPGPGG